MLIGSIGSIWTATFSGIWISPGLGRQSWRGGAAAQAPATRRRRNTCDGSRPVDRSDTVGVRVIHRRARSASAPAAGATSRRSCGRSRSARSGRCDRPARGRSGTACAPSVSSARKRVAAAPIRAHCRRRDRRRRRGARRAFTSTKTISPGNATTRSSSPSGQRQRVARTRAALGEVAARRDLLGGEAGVMGEGAHRRHRRRVASPMPLGKRFAALVVNRRLVSSRASSSARA